jgi:hypothetical protein
MYIIPSIKVYASNLCTKLGVSGRLGLMRLRIEELEREVVRLEAQ